MILKTDTLAQELLKNLQNNHIKKTMAIVQVGDDQVSSKYVQKKIEMGELLKDKILEKKLPSSISSKNLLSEINTLNETSDIDGIIVQMPMPQHIDEFEVMGSVSEKKDIDGFRYILGESDRFVPPTVLAIDEIINYFKIDLSGELLIVGHGKLVGRPLEKFWRNKNLKVSILRKDDHDYFSRLKNSDVIVIATGGNFKFRHDDFKVGSTVIDASTVSENGKIKGDVIKENWPENKNLCPVPGGVGPITLLKLFENLSIS